MRRQIETLNLAQEIVVSGGLGLVVSRLTKPQHQREKMHGNSLAGAEGLWWIYNLRLCPVKYEVSVRQN